MLNILKSFSRRFVIMILAICATVFFGFVGNVLAGDLVGTPNVSISDHVVGNNANYDVSFTTSIGGAIEPNGKVNITFPVGFDISSASLGTYSLNLGSATYVINGQTFQVLVGNDGAVADSDSVSIQVLGVINHTISDINYQLTVETLDALNQNIDGPNSSQSFALYPRPPSQIQSSIDTNPTGTTEMTVDSTLGINFDLKDEFGNVIANEDVQWSVSNTNFTLDRYTGITDANGQDSVILYAPTIAGEQTTVTARAGSIVNSISITTASIITNPDVTSSVNISPDSEQIIAAGEVIEFTAEAFDQYGNSTGDEIIWSGANENGIFTATLPGNYTVYATANGIESTHVNVIVTHAEAVLLSISPENIHLANADQTQDYIVTAYDQHGNFWDASCEVTFSTTDPKGTFVGNVYHAGKVGTWEIKATLNNVGVSTNVTIDGPGTPVSIEITNAPTEVNNDQIYHFNVKLYDAHGNEVQPLVIYWEVIFGTGTGIIDQTGAFQGILPGTVSVKVTAITGDLSVLETIITFTVKEPSKSGDSGTTSDKTEEKSDKTTTQKIKQYFVPTAQAAETTTEQPSDENGQIKGTEIATIGPEEEEAIPQSSTRNLWISLLLACLVLGLAYYGYTYFSSKELKEVEIPVKKDTKGEVKKAVKDEMAAGEKPSEEIKDIPQKDDEDKLRW